MGTFDSGTYRSHKDTLDRLSRPQRQSTWIQIKREWRYATGVFQHTDLEDSSRRRTTWDNFDYDYQTTQALQDADQDTTTGNSDSESKGEDTLHTTITPASTAPNSCTLRNPVPSRRSTAPACSQLHLTSDSVAAMNRAMHGYPLLSPPVSSTDDKLLSKGSPTPRTPQTPDSASRTRTMNSAPSTESLPDETWHDETRDFNMLAVRITLRGPHERPCDLVKNYNWYPDAVPIDALLPPGVPLSAKEICAYYPHHVRWQDMMLRLAHNDYRGPDILGIQAVFRGASQDHMSPPVMNQIQRDAVQGLLPAFKTAGYEGKGDADIYTDRVKPGAYLEKKLKGYTVPTFDDLLRGLMFLPYGQDARGLTQCLAWYLDVCSAFTPKLELNVLHAQALIRALRQPSKPVGSQNLNSLGLKQWREQGAFQKTKNTIAGQDGENIESEEHYTGQCPRPKAVFTIHKNSVDLKMHIHVPIRHILTFPFLALHGVVSEAFQLGVYNAQRRRTLSKGSAMPEKHESADNVSRKDTPQCTPKRPRQVESYGNSSPTETSKRQRKLDDRPGDMATRTPKRPTVSPITPRTSTQRLTQTQSNTLPIKWKSSLLKRG